MNEAKVEFLKTDLDVGITFVKIARTSADPETVSRNQRNARKAYDAVAHFLSTVTLTQIDQLALLFEGGISDERSTSESFASISSSQVASPPACGTAPYSKVSSMSSRADLSRSSFVLMFSHSSPLS
jgi:hypothetical protein